MLRKGGKNSYLKKSDNNIVNLLNVTFFPAKRRLVYVRAGEKTLQSHHPLPPKLTINTKFSLELEVELKNVIKSLYKIFAVKC